MMALKLACLTIFTALLFLVFAGCRQSHPNPENNVPAVPMLVFIRPLNHFDTSLAKKLQIEIQHILLVPVRLMPGINLPAKAWYAPRHRYWADSILVILKPFNLTKNSFTLGVTDADISTKKDFKLNWAVMGLGFQPGNCCVVSTYRLYRYPQTENQLLEKLLKVALHELCHNAGLPHCANNRCIMADAKGKDNLANEIDFCPDCRKTLAAKGLQPAHLKPL